MKARRTHKQNREEAETVIALSNISLSKFCLQNTKWLQKSILK